MESHLLRTMRLFERWTPRGGVFGDDPEHDQWKVERRTRPWRPAVEGEAIVLVHTGREWKSRHTIETYFGLELDSHGNVVVDSRGEVVWHQLTRSERREVSRALRNLEARGKLLKKKTKDRGALFGIKGLVVESPPGGWDHVEDFLLARIGVRGKLHRLLL